MSDRELEGVRLGMSADQLREALDRIGAQHNLPDTPGSVDFVNVIRPAGPPRRLKCTLRDGVVVSINAVFDPPAPEMVAGIVSSYHQWNDVSAIGMFGGLNEDRSVAGYGTLDGKSATITDLRLERPDDSARLLELFGPPKGGS